MAMFKVRKKIVITGGSVLLGADTNIYRLSANSLKTDDALTVAGVLTTSSTTTHTGAVTFSAGANHTSGTPFVLPYGTASPTMDTNGQISTYAKANVNYIVLRLAGTTIVGALPSAAANGTVSWTVGSPP